jgi:hypothetical protein
VGRFQRGRFLNRNVGVAICHHRRTIRTLLEES